MAKLDARRIAGFLADPGAARIVLVFGEDGGLVRERADALVRAVAGDDPFRLVDVPRDVAAKDAGLLAAEAATPALTGGRRLVRVRDATDGLANAAKAVLAGSGPGLVLLEAGSLDGRKGLRAALEKAGPEAAVIACYAETGAALEASITALLNDFGVSAEPSAVAWMAQRLGEDRLVMRRECEKLALYVGASGRVTEEDAVASLSEGSTLDLDAALLAATEGDAARADRALDAAFAEGAHAVQVVRGALRHVQRLEVAAMAVARGAAPKDAVDGLRPPVFFKSRPSFERALRLWRPEMLAAAGAALLDAERATKTTGMPDTAVARAAVMGLAREAVRARRG
ncbi:DNA polymerase III subunit delta [Roseomonas rosulenta]|uniref:DNA polymerase III subunit delta n=1 Tax=Roseomonas rosulenta TaxID=2748667 RepID=UPI0018DF2D92|nr:DNA polymerase III subunit delta [Roseomonas rosulenta]